MKKFFISRLAIALLFLSSCAQKETTVPFSTITPRIDSIGQRFIDEGKVLGLFIAVMDKDDTLYHRGFGYADIQKTRPVNDSTIFRIASISKLMGSVVVMKLVEEDKLSLDQTLQELLPDFPNPEQGQKITLRHLLSHTSGLQDYATIIDTVYSQTGIPPTREDYFRFFQERELFFEPGADYSYCNSGFLLMAMIVERITGKSYQSEVDRVLNEPGDLHLKLIAENAANPNMSGYGELNGSSFTPISHWTWIKGDGGLTTTVLELARFPHLWSKGVFTKKESFEKMSRPTLLTDGVETGYGIGVRNGDFLGEKMIGHTGGNISLLAIMAYFPEKELSIAVCVNTDNTPANARKIFGEVTLSVLEKEAPDFTQNESTDEDLTKYEGTYNYEGYKVENALLIRQNADDGHLYYCWDENECEKMYPIGNGEFRIERWPLDKVVFDADSTGEVRAIREYYTGYYVVLRRKVK